MNSLGVGVFSDPDGHLTELHQIFMEAISSPNLGIFNYKLTIKPQPIAFKCD